MLPFRFTRIQVQFKNIATILDTTTVRTWNCEGFSFIGDQSLYISET
jgi:hypothetical protein